MWSILGYQQVMDAYLVRVADQHHGRIDIFDRRMAIHANSPGTVQVIAG